MPTTTVQDVQRATWAVDFHRHFHPEARPFPPDVWDTLKPKRFPPDVWDTLKPISLADAVDILWNDAEAKRNEAKERTHDEEGVTPASLLALMRLYTAYELHGLYPEVFQHRFPDGHLPDDLSSVFPVNREKVRELYTRTAPSHHSKE